MRGAGLLALVVLVASAAPALAQKKIVIDAGHGGSDPGGVGTGMQEKNIVIDVAKRFRDLLKADTADTAGGGAWVVNLTRTDDTYVGLSARASYANSIGADRFMSIHSNAFSDPSANGTETFAYSEGGQGAALRNLVQEEMIAAWGLRNRGNKTANFAVLRETSMPAVLHELAFITNATDAAKLGSAAERQKAAEAHLRAIQRHYGITPYIPGSMPDPPTDGTIDVAVSDSDGPLAGAAVTLDGEAAGTTGADGTLTLAAVAVGDHVVGAAAEGHSAADSPVTVVGGQSVGADLFLEQTAEPDPDEEDPGADPIDPAGEQPVDPPAGGVTGGCAISTGAGDVGAALLLMIALLAARRRQNGRSSSMSS